MTDEFVRLADRAPAHILIPGKSYSEYVRFGLVEILRGDRIERYSLLGVRLGGAELLLQYQGYRDRKTGQIHGLPLDGLMAAHRQERVWLKHSRDMQITLFAPASLASMGPRVRV